jgi:hypothetical protein
VVELRGNQHDSDQDDPTGHQVGEPIAGGKRTGLSGVGRSERSQQGQSNCHAYLLAGGQQAPGQTLLASIHMLVGGELRHRLALLRPVSAPAGCPLPGRLGTADHGYQAASVARGSGNGDIAGSHTLSREAGSIMNIILQVILAVYNFFVGDLVILLGVTLTMVVLALIHFLDALATLRGGSGAILIAGVLVTLVATLGREIMRPENRQRA